MRKTISVFFILCIFLLSIVTPGFAYSKIQNARSVYKQFDDDNGKGEVVGDNYRLYAKKNSYTRYASIPQEAKNATAWDIEAEVLAMEGAGAGIFLVYSDKQGLGAEIAKDGALTFWYMETRRNEGIYKWKIAETRIPEVKIPSRLGVTYSYYTTEYSVTLNGKTLLSGKASDSSFFPLMLGFDTIGIKTINSAAKQQGYCDFGEMVVNIN